MENSHISWTTHTFNPWIGCTKVSPGCLHCYAEARDQRFAGGAHWGKGAPRQRTSAANWKQPLKWNDAPRNGVCQRCGKQWRGPAEGDYFCDGCGGEIRFERPRVFCASLADWLDDEVPIEWLSDLLKLIHDTPNLDWLLLTKRPENFVVRVLMAGMDMMGYVDGQRSDKPEALADAKEDTIESVLGWSKGETCPPNVWLGTTVEDQSRKARMDVLRTLPAAIRFLSCEPLLEELGPMDFTGIAWCIVGGESGPGARPMDEEWALELRDQCAAAGDVDFHFKQWGGPDNKARGRLLAGGLHDAVPRLSNN